MIVLVRHGATEWSTSRRHTGRTDIPLTDEGRAQAASLAPLLAGLHPDRVLTSPLSRARETCALAGFGGQAEVDDRLVEWDYGEAEGRTTAEIRQELDPLWSVWTHGVQEAETLGSVAARVDSVIADLRAGPADAKVLVFAHAHLLRIFGARWCGLHALVGQNLTLDPASISILGSERETPVIERWNVVPFT